MLGVGKCAMTRGKRNRRRRERALIEKPAAVEVDGEQGEILAIVKDVSTTGMSLLIDEFVAIGCSVRVRAPLDGDQHGVKGEVVRVETFGPDCFLIGVRYDLLSLEDDFFFEEALRLRAPSKQ